MGSSRLSGKTLKNLNGKPLLWHVYNRCKTSKYADLVVVATTTDKSDNPIEKFCKKHKIPCFRGEENNVLSRYYGAAKKFKIDIVIRIPGDCPLTDSHTIDRCFVSFKRQKCDYISNVVPGERTFPRGLDVEVFSFSALEKAYNEAVEDIDKEHVTPYIWRNNKREYKIGEIVTAPPDLKRSYRLTVDYPEDFTLINTIYKKLGKYKIIPAVKAIKFLDKRPEIASINADCEQKHDLYAKVNILQKAVGMKK